MFRILVAVDGSEPSNRTVSHLLKKLAWYKGPVEVHLLNVQPPLPSWGLMISEAKQFMFFSFWLIAIPGTALALMVLGINLAGDGLRDVLAPEGRS